ncbi:MAG: hypothetical protein KDI52_10100 [Xanthomonadales bacterium]|nr:hypothetical protein [Xanthomonadales bacterium]
MKKNILVSTLFALISVSAFAENPSFDYIDAGYSNWDPDGSISKIDGFELKFSKSVNDNYYIAGDFNRVTQYGNALNFSTLGFGYMNAFSEKSTFFAELDYAYSDASPGTSENGFEFTTGVRSMVTEQFELKGAIEHLNFDGSDRTSVVLGGVYSFNENFAIYLDYKFESDLNRMAAGLRYNF